MLQPWLIAFLIFAAIFLIVQFGYAYFFEDLQRTRKTKQRFATLRDERNFERQQQVVKARGKRADGKPTRFEQLLVQSGFEGRRGAVGIAVVGLWLAFYVAAMVFPWFLRVPLSGAAALLVVLGVLVYLRARRIRRFAEQLPDVLDVIVRSLKAGHPLPVSLSLVAREMPAPAGEEFAVVSDEITYGRETRDALDNLYWRVGHLDLQLLVTSISVTYQTGGNLSDILARLSRMLRERFRMRRKVRALSSEGRFSAAALSFFPFIMFGIINTIAPPYYGLVWGNPLLNVAATAAGIFLVIGNIIMYRMVNFRI